jgi:hypothetical protein
VAVRVQRHAVSAVAELRRDVRDRHTSGDLHAGVEVPQVVRRLERDPRGLAGARMMFLIVAGVAPGNTRRSEVRSSCGTVRSISTIRSSGTATQRLAAAVFPPRTLNRDPAVSTSRHSSAWSSPTRIPVSASVWSASRHLRGLWVTITATASADGGSTIVRSSRGNLTRLSLAGVWVDVCVVEDGCQRRDVAARTRRLQLECGDEVGDGRRRDLPRVEAAYQRQERRGRTNTACLA